MSKMTDADFQAFYDYERNRDVTYLDDIHRPVIESAPIKERRYYDTRITEYVNANTDEVIASFDESTLQELSREQVMQVIRVMMRLRPHARSAEDELLRFKFGDVVDFHRLWSTV